MKYLNLALAVLTLTVSHTALAQSAAKTAPDAKTLAERHIKPAGGTHAIVFNDKGEAIAITANGKVIPECQLPKASADGKAAKDARPADPKAGKLPICPGTTNTTLTGVSQVTSISHVGSNCITYVICGNGKCQFYTVCW
ncbi:MAG: hypothetical protein ACK44V_10380 [Burkholderiales bacterium]